MEQRRVSGDELLAQIQAANKERVQKAEKAKKMGLEDKLRNERNPGNQPSPTYDFLSGLYHGTKGAILWNKDSAIIGLKGFFTNPADLPKRRDYLKEALDNLNCSTASSWGYGIGNLVTGNPLAWTLMYIAYDKFVKGN